MVVSVVLVGGGTVWVFWGRRVCGSVSSISGGVTVWVFWG